MDKMLGQVIPIKKDDLKVVDSIHESRKTGEVILTEAMTRIKHADESLWELIADKYPQTKDYHISVYWPDHEIHIMRVKKDWEKKA